jgi:hypothetical protein
MADISKITLLNGTTYNIKDATARESIPATYAGSATAGGDAIRALSVPFATVDSTSTSTVFTVQVPEFANETELRDGLFFFCYNNKVTSAEECTLNVNGLGAKPFYASNGERTKVGFSANEVFPLWYDSSFVEGGCWRIGYLTDTDTNTTYSVFQALQYGDGSLFLMDSVLYRYQLIFQMDDDYATPLNNVSNKTTTSKAMLTNVEFDPFGQILYYSTTTTVAAEARPKSSYLRYESNFDLRYTFNCGSTLTAYKPFYLVVNIGSNGKAKIASSKPWAQELPTENDGHYYIFLGRTYSTHQLSLYPWHPIFYHDGTGIKEYVKPNNQSLPTVTTSDNGKFLQVVNGAWAAVTIPSANGGSF